jgi:hypothetical protein
MMKDLMTRFLSGICAAVFIMLALVAAQAQPVTVSIDEVEAASGEIVCVPITIENVGANIITAFEMTISYNPDMVRPISPFYATAGCLANSWMVYPNNAGPAGRFSIGGFGTAPLSGSGCLLCLNFEVLSCVTGQTEIELTELMLNEGNPQGVPVSGSITVEGNSAFVSLISAGPPDWSYSLNWVSGQICYLRFTNFCLGTTGSISPEIESAGWNVINYSDSIVFLTTQPLTSGAIGPFILSHPSCADVINWSVFDSTGSIDGPLPVELLSFAAAPGDRMVTLTWETASEIDAREYKLIRDGSAIHAADAENSATGSRYEWTDAGLMNNQTYHYDLIAVDISGEQSLLASSEATPVSSSATVRSFSLRQNYPNPFNPETTIEFDLLESGFVTLRVFNLTGQSVATLAECQFGAGYHAIQFDATLLPTGVYIYRLESKGSIAQRKMILLR